MSGLIFKLRAAPPERLDLSGLTPSKLSGVGASGIERLAIGTTRHPLRVADVFAVTGDDAAEIRFEGGSERFDRLGEAMDGGMILVEGDAGDDLGGPGFGEAAGMTGGTIRVSGSTGARAGDRMRRGTILVSGDCGPHAGCRMIAGNLLCKGRAGRGAGALMKRGTLVFAGGTEPLGPTFLDNGPQDLVLLRLMARAFPTILDENPMRRFAGDTAVSSMGEVFVPA